MKEQERLKERPSRKKSVSKNGNGRPKNDEKKPPTNKPGKKEKELRYNLSGVKLVFDLDYQDSLTTKEITILAKKLEQSYFKTNRGTKPFLPFFCSFRGRIQQILSKNKARHYTKWGAKFI